jgi:non-specific serine/threonine protein kinase
MAYTLWNHQRETLNWISSIEEYPPNPFIKGGIIGLSMGLGKTLIALHHCFNDKGKSLIVTNKSIISEWTENGTSKFFPQKNVLVVDNKKKESCLENLDEYDIVITSYPHLCVAYKNGYDLMNIEWRRVIFDESHLISKRNSLIYKASLELKATYRWCMTGTPYCNKTRDLKSQIEVCGFPFNKRRWSAIIDNDKVLEHIKVINVVKTNDTRNDNIHIIDMTEKQKTVYNDVLKRGKNNIEEAINHTYKLGAIGSMITKLRQISNGSDMLSKKNNFDDNHKVSKIINIAKSLQQKPFTLKQLCMQQLSHVPPEYINQHIHHVPVIPHEKMIIFSSFRKSFTLIADAMQRKIPEFKYLQLNGSVKNKAKVISQFKEDPTIQCLFIMYSVGCEGLNLTNASVVVLFEPWWNNTRHEQAIARCWRNGQNRKVIVHQLITKDSIEENMLKLCTQKINNEQLCWTGKPQTKSNQCAINKLLKLVE